MFDCHVHTERCGHATGMPGAYATAAARAGLEGIAFTDHLPLPPGYPKGYAMTWQELHHYVMDVRALQLTEPVEVLLGIEADWLPDRTAELREVLSSYPYDVVLGSVHFVDDWAFDDPDMRHRYAEWTPEALWERYFGEVASAAESGLFDVMAHPDLVKKFRFRPEEEPLEVYAELARAFARAGVAAEVSTAGLRKECGEIYPSSALLRAFRAEGVPVTIGSDAHRPEEVGYRFEAASVWLAEAGYDSAVVYRGRVAEEVAL